MPKFETRKHFKRLFKLSIPGMMKTCLSVNGKKRKDFIFKILNIQKLAKVNDYLNQNMRE